MSGRITCAWCKKIIAPKSPRMRLFESDSVRTEGKTLASFYPGCGDDLLDCCETSTTSAAVAPIMVAKADMMRRVRDNTKC